MGWCLRPLLSEGGRSALGNRVWIGFFGGETAEFFVGGEVTGFFLVPAVERGRTLMFLSLFVPTVR